MDNPNNKTNEEFYPDLGFEDGTAKRSLPSSSPEGRSGPDNTCYGSSQGRRRECQDAVEGVIPGWVRPTERRARRH